MHIQRGEIALSKYYTQFITTPIDWLSEVEKEFNFELNGIKFKGFIDRIDLLNNEIMLYDYKTGKAKAKSLIAPDKDHEDYYNQMAFYKYALEKTTGKKVKSATFIFPEEFEKNLTLELSEEEVQNVIQKYTNAVNNIQACNFEPIKDINNENCKYCQYKDFCNLDIL
jgi:CRISPR/Cas system-associated exonuclease Cas4 (RecB family)